MSIVVTCKKNDRDLAVIGLYNYTKVASGFLSNHAGIVSTILLSGVTDFLPSGLISA
jgi:hypothetical protein